MTQQQITEIATEVTENLFHQNWPGSQTVVFHNFTTGTTGTMNRDHFPMPGERVVFFGGCKTKADVVERLNER